MQEITPLQIAVAHVQSAFPTMKESEILALIKATNEIGGCSFVSIKNYNSDKSENTELANHVVNVGAAYSRMKEKAVKEYKDITAAELAAISLDEHNYSGYVIPDLTAFKIAVRAEMATALEELQNPKTKAVSNDIWLNKVLVFNLNTQRLSIFGQSVNKTVVEKGDFKKVKSAPKTVAKNIIKEYCEPTREKLRRFTLDNLNTVLVRGETLEIQ